MGPYWSAITDAYTRNDFEWIKNTVNKLLLIVLVGLGVAFVMYLLSRYDYYNTSLGLLANLLAKLRIFICFSD